MPTEVTTNTGRPLSQVSDVQKPAAVMGANRSEPRQALSSEGQSVPPAKESGQTSNQQLLAATDNMNKHVQSLKRDLHFSVDEDTGETVIRVIDSESKETIRTIPSEEFLSVAQHLNQTVGMLLNAEA
jgi:flagellar protein FlaG